MTVAQTWARTLRYVQSSRDQVLPDLVDDWADLWGFHIALRDGGRVVSYGGLARRVNRYAHWGQQNGLKPGDVIALLAPNGIDYFALWMGLTRIGCVVALINTNLKADGIRHCIDTASAKFIIFASKFTNVMPPVSKGRTFESIRDELENYSSESTRNEFVPSPQDTALLIYTSGTTGYPKATNITHRRIVEWSYWFAGMMDAKSSDILYNCLPMYHSIGGVVAIGSMLVMGGSVFIREKFSASQFWPEIAQNGCTIFQYIGELCRYLTQAGDHPLRRLHQLRLACGNGLQKDVWEQFQAKFDIPHILEFYAATEGSLSLYNVEEKPGAIGRIPPFLAHQFIIQIVKIDPDTNVPVRTADGLCVVCGPDEPGEAISSLVGQRQFDGYTDPKASVSKILRHVMATDDRWFRSGDLMRRDAAGYFYFVDRLGDTFRWKGENVSTTEVEAVIRAVHGVIDAVVYGIGIPGQEGRAGMVALLTTENFSFAELSKCLWQNLPDYAHPVFLRMCSTLDMTGTFKLQKADLVREGFEPHGDDILLREQNGDYRLML